MDAGLLDPTFGVGGKLLTDFPGTGYAVAVQPDGKIVVAGGSAADYSSDFSLMRFNSDGSPDLTFGSGGLVLTDFSDLTEKQRDMAADLVVQADGKILVVGNQSTIDGAGLSHDFLLARYNPDGSLDATFGTGGRTHVRGPGYSGAYDVDLLPDGKFLVSGTLGYEFGVMRFNPDGSLDTTFGKPHVTFPVPGTVRFFFNLPGVTSPNNHQGYDVEVFPDGKFVLGGFQIVKPDAMPQFALAGFNADGSPDLSFGTNGQVLTKVTFFDEIYALKALPDGDIIAVGDTSGDDKIAVVRYNRDGTLDTSFGEGGVKVIDYDGGDEQAWEVVTQPDGKIVIAGHTNSPTGPETGSATSVGEDRGWCMIVVRLNGDGSFDTTFGPHKNGKARTDFGFTDDYTFGVALQPDGNIVVVGTAGTKPAVEGTGKVALARFLGDAVVNQAPTVVTAASATPNPVTGTTANLTVLGGDDGGESNLTYSWALQSGPAAVAFSANNNNAAKNTTVTFSQAGSYSFTVTIRDAGGLTTTSSVTVTVNQTLTSIVVSPATAKVGHGMSQQFAASARDQFGNPLSTQPAISWSLDAGSVGSISSSGKYTAPTSGSGTATVRAAAGGVSGMATVTVVPKVTISASDGTATETGDTGTFKVTRTGSTSSPLTVYYSLGGSATPGSDYQSLAGSVTIPAGSSSTTFTITPINDGLVEGRETVVASLVDNSAYAVGSGGATVTIHDDEKPTVSVSVVDGVGNEAPSNTITFRITRTPATSAPLTVRYTLGGTASNGADYGSLGGTAVIAGNASSVNVTVTPIDDSLLEGRETVTLSLTDDAAYQVGTRSQTATLYDDDKPTVSVSRRMSSVTEGAAAIFRVSLTSGVALSRPVTVSFTLSGTAQAGQDYVAPASYTVTIPAGSTYADISITTINTSIKEGTRSLTLTLVTDPALDLAASSATISILDND